MNMLQVTSIDPTDACPGHLSRYAFDRLACPFY